MCRVGKKKSHANNDVVNSFFFPPSLNPPTPPSVIGSYGFNSSPIPKSGSDIRAYSQRKPNPSLSEKNLGNQVLHKQDEQSKILQINRLQQHTHCSTSRPGWRLSPSACARIHSFEDKNLVTDLTSHIPTAYIKHLLPCIQNGGGKRTQKGGGGGGKIRFECKEESDEV